MENHKPDSATPHISCMVAEPDTVRRADREKLWRYGPWPQACFMHIGKTGGTSVFQALSRRFNPLRTYHGDPQSFSQLSPGEIDHFEYVTGHFSYCHVRLLRPQRVLFSMVREPVERVVSTYFFLRSWDGLITDENRIMVSSAQRFSLLDFMKDDHPQVLAVRQNQQTYAFASNWLAARTANDASVIESALSHLNDFTLIGLTERSNDTMTMLGRMLRWESFTPLERATVTPKRPLVADLTRHERNAIEECNHLDHRLYQVVKRRFESLWNASQPANPRWTARLVSFFQKAG